tara:strand:+ start:327 stop:473 length:147 start_codon:yes stop_codon:yes gene_type:complete
MNYIKVNNDRMNDIEYAFYDFNEKKEEEEEKLNNVFSEPRMVKRTKIF